MRALARFVGTWELVRLRDLGTRRNEMHAGRGQKPKADRRGKERTWAL